MAVNAAKNLYSKFGVTLEEEPRVADNLYSKFGVIPEEEELVSQPGLQHELAQTYTDSEGNIRRTTKIPGMLGGGPLIQGIVGARGFKKGALDVLSNLADYPAVKAPIDAIGGLFDTPGEGRDWTDVGQATRELAEDRYGIIPGPDTFEAVKEAEGLAKIPAAAKYMVTQTPSMAAYTSGALAAPGLMMMSENQRLAVERAVNDNKISPEFSEYLATAPQAVINILLDRLPFLLSGGVFRRFTTGIGTEFVQGATEVPSTKLDTEAWLNVPLNQKIMETLESGAAEALAAGPLEAGGAFIDLSQRRQDARERPPRGELDLDETQPIVGPPGPTATVTGPPTPPLVGPPAPSPFVGPPAPPPFVGPPAPGETVPTDVPTTSTPIETRPRATEEAAVYTPREGETDIGPEGQAYTFTEGQWVNNQTGQIAEDSVQRELSAAPRRGADPLAGGVLQNFKNIINELPPLKNILGGPEARKNYIDAVANVFNNLNQLAGEARYQTEQDVSDLMWEYGLLSDETGISTYTPDDGQKREIEITESLDEINPEIKNVPTAKSNLTALLAAYFESNPKLYRVFKEAMEMVSALDGEFPGGLNRKLKVNIDITGTDEYGRYNPADHTITFTLISLMGYSEGMQGFPDVKSTAIHETAHKNIWSFWVSEAVKKVESFGLEISDAAVLSEATRLMNEWGTILLPMMKADLRIFVADSFKNIDPSKAGTVLAEKMNLRPEDPVYQELSRVKKPKQAMDILLKAVKNGLYSKIIHPRTGEVIDAPTTIAYQLIHEIIAYHDVKADMFMGSEKAVNEKQKSFIRRFLDAAQKAFQKVLKTGQITFEQTRDFAYVLMLEPIGAAPSGSINQTALMRAYNEYKTGETYRQANQPRYRGTEDTTLDDAQPSRMARRDDEVDLSKRKFLKQTAGAVAGAVVDPTILAEPATKAAVGIPTAVAKGGWVPHAIATVYRFAVSVPVETQEGETIEGEAIIDIEYDSASNTLSVQTLDEDADVITEEKFEVPIEDPSMRQIDDFAAQIIKTGVNPMDPKGSQIFDPKAVYSVQAPIRDPHHEELADEDRVMNEQDLEEYSEIDADFMGGLASPREYRGGLEPINPAGSEARRGQQQGEISVITPPRVTLEGEPVGPPERIMKGRKRIDDRLIADPGDSAADVYRTPRVKPDKVIDTLTQIVTENAETLETIKEAVKDLTKTKPVEGEVIPAKRKREPGMAEEETIQELQDILAGVEERYQRLQDVGRDVDIETIEEYEAEIKEYEKDIRELKEEIKEEKARMPFEKGEVKPEDEIPPLRQARTREAETLEQEYNELTKNINDNYQIPILDNNKKPTGETITLSELAKQLASGSLDSMKESNVPGTTSKGVKLYTEEFWKAYLKFFYSEDVNRMRRPEAVKFFNNWNKKVGKILTREDIPINSETGKPGFHWTQRLAATRGGRSFPQFWEYTRGGKITQLPAKEMRALKELVDELFPSDGKPKLPDFHATKKDVSDALSKNSKQLFEEWVNEDIIPTNQTHLKNLKNIKQRIKDHINEWNKDDFKNIKSTKFSKEWFKEIKDMNVFNWEKGKWSGEKVENINLFDLIDKLMIGVRDAEGAAKTKARKIIAGRNIGDAFKTLLNKDSYEGWSDAQNNLKSTLTKEIWDKYKKETKDRKLTNEEIEQFIETNLNVQFERETKANYYHWQALADHITSVGINETEKIPVEVDHIQDLGMQDDIEGAEEIIDSLGYDHPLAWAILPAFLNRFTSFKTFELKKNGKKSTSIQKLESMLGADINSPLDLPIFVDYLNRYFNYLNERKEEAANNPNKYIVDAAIESINYILTEYADFIEEAGWNVSKSRRKAKPEKILTPSQLDALDLGITIDVELSKESLYKDTEAQFEFVRNNRALFATIANKEGNFDNNFDDIDMPQELKQARKAHEDAKEYKREAGWHQTGWNTFTSFMWSKPVETIRRYRYASPTMAKLADMIQRDISETKRVIKGGLDYIQRKGMALGQFRVALQAVLDNMTGRTGVMSKAVNDAVALYLIQGTPIKDPKVAKAAEEMKQILESIYVWSTELGSKITKDFSLRPLDGGLLPRVWNIEELATANGRKKFMKLLASIGIVDNLESDNEFEQTAATDAYNIALNSGGFISGDFTTTAYNQKSKKRRKFQVELFDKIEKEVSRAKLGTLLVNDIQAALPRFVDKAIEKTLYAELFGHYDEALWEMKTEIEKEIREYNQREGIKRPVKSERAMKDIDDMMAIIRHRFKMDSAWFHTRRYVQWFTNFTTVTLMPFVSLASMPEFFTPLMLGSKNPVGFVNDFRSVSWYAALRAMNGMSKLFRGKQLDAMLYPKGKAARRAMFLKALGIIDIKSQGEAAAMRYIGPSFIRTGIAAQGPGAKLGIKALYKLYGLGDAATGRFRARKVRSLMNMDTYFELVLLTSLTQMQQQMAANNLRRYTISLLKSISKGKGNTLQDMKILKDFGLTREEINEAVRWYKAGHREFYDVPAEFKWDPSGMTLRFVDQVITRPNEATAAKAFRHPGMAPLLIFKSFMTTFGNTFMVAMRDRVRFAEGEGTAKTRQQAKMVAGYLATIGAMYGMVMFAQSIRHMLQYDDDDDDYMDDVPEWKKFVAILNRTGLLTAPGSQLVDIFLPFKYGWWQTPSKRTQDVILGPAVGQGEEILDLIGDLINKGEVDLEKFLARIAPITKYEMFRDMVGAPSYYEKD